MPDMVETYAGAGPAPWWEGISPTVQARTLLDHNVPWHEMVTLAGLDWDVEKSPMYLATGEQVPEYVALTRATDRAILGMAKESYELFQNMELGEVGDAILSRTSAHWHTSGSLMGGRLVWALAEVDGDVYVRGDGSPLKNYLLLFTGHDGRHALTLLNTLVRVLCWNTLTAAIEGATEKFVLKHTKNMGERLALAEKALGINARYTEAMVATLNDLTTRPMTLGEVTAFTEVLLPINPEAEHPWRTEAERRAILDVYLDSPLVRDLPMTAYRAYQSVTEYLDHHKAYRNGKVTRSDRRAVAIIEGSALTMKSNALRLLVRA